MSDSTTDTGQEPSGETATTTEAAETDWKAQARKWEDRAKANHAAAEKAADLEKQLADVQAQLVTATQTITEFEAEKSHAEWVKNALEAADLPDSYAGVLRGDSAEALLAHAEALKPLVKPQAAPVPDAGKTPDTQMTPEQRAVTALFGPK